MASLVGRLALLLTGCVGTLGGAFHRDPAETPPLSSAALALVQRAYTGVDGERLFDHHTHVVGLGTGDTGTWVNPAMRSWSSPIRRYRFSIYANAAGVTDLAAADEQYVQQLLRLATSRPHPGRLLLLAFDHHYEKDGTQNLEHSEFYVPNDYVVALTAQFPKLFVPAMSVHPYRKDAIAEVRRQAARGVRLIKWLPNAMGIDPADPEIDPFYDELSRLGITLLTHAGLEKAVEAEADQALGNPLRLRRPLDRGVRVIVAHCASLGDDEDLDHPDRPRVPSFELFLRLMDEPRYDDLLFGEISALPQANRLGAPLTTMLDRTDLHRRLVNGSDYPLPAINVVVRLDPLVEGGWLADDDAEPLAEIYDHNPLLFDFVLKRSLRSPVGGARFAPQVFYDRPELL